MAETDTTYTAKNAAGTVKSFRAVIDDSGNLALYHKLANANAKGYVGKFVARNAADSADIDPLAETTFTGRIGEVQASPTANTVLARLKDLLSLIVLAAGDNNIGNVDVASLPATPSGTNLIGRVGIDAQAANGASPYRNLDLGVTGQVVKGSAGNLYAIHAINTNASARYLKIYNKATAPSESDTPVFTFSLPQGGSNIFLGDPGVSFATGIGVRATTAIADNDTGAPGSNEVVVNLSYK